MIIDSKTTQKIKAFITSGDDLLVVTHFHPDGDAVGSLVAFGGILDQMGASYVLAVDDPCPVKYRFMPGFSKIRNLKSDSLDDLFKKVVILDAGALPRIGSAQQYFDHDAEILNIDHHFTGSYYGNINLVDVDASATSEILYDLCKELEIELESQIIYGLYVGILTDTGRLRFSNTNAQALKICGDLVQRGVNPCLVTENIFYNMSLNVLKALAWGLTNLDLHYDGLFSMIYLDLAHYLPDTEEFVEFASSVNGVAIAAFLCEMEKDIFKVSIRSRCRIDVSEVARRLGGGGHRKAAGFRFNGSLEELKEKLLDEIGSEIKKYNLIPGEPVLEMSPEDGDTFPEWILKQAMLHSAGGGEGPGAGSI